MPVSPSCWALAFALLAGLAFALLAGLTLAFAMVAELELLALAVVFVLVVAVHPTSSTVTVIREKRIAVRFMTILHALNRASFYFSITTEGELPETVVESLASIAELLFPSNSCDAASTAGT